MTAIRSRVLGAALLGTTALITPSIAAAQTVPPRFQTVDDNGVELVSGQYVAPFVEGSIGSGKGAVSIIRNSGGPDQWSGLLYRTTIGGVSTMVVQFGPIADTFTISGSTYTPTKANGATLTSIGAGAFRYTSPEGTAIVYKTQVTEEGEFGQLYQIDGPGCGNAEANSCAIPVSITLPDGLVFRPNWEFDFDCGGTIFPCPDPRAYFRFNGVASSANYGFTRSYATNNPGNLNAPVPDWYKLTGATFWNGSTAQGSVSYAHPSASVEQFTDVAGRVWTFTTAADGSSHIRRPGSATDNIIVGHTTSNGTVTYVTKDGVTTNYSRSVSGTTGTIVTTDPLGNHQTIVSNLSLGRVTSFTDERGKTWSYQYDSNARLTRITAPEGNYRQFAYDSRGNVTTVTNVAKSGSGLSNIVASASFDSTCTNVVKCNKPNSTTDAKGNVTDYTYSTTHGGILTVTRPAPSTGAVRPQTRFTYSQVSSASGDPVTMPTGLSACQTAASCTGGADESKTTIAYNGNLLPSSVTSANGTGTLGATTAMTYDARGNTLTVDGPLSGTADTTAFKYDSADQMIGTISPDPDGAGSLTNRAIRITYRPDGQVSKREIGTTAGQSDADWANFVSLQAVTITFDPDSRPTVAKLSGGGTNHALTQTTYDSLGRVDCVAVRMNKAAFGSLPASACTLGTEGSFGPDRITRTVYDSASQVTEVKVAVGTSDAATTSTMSYTNNGMLATLKDGESNLTTFDYDGFDRLSKTRFPVPAKGANASSTTDYEQLTYDANSNVTQRRQRDGNSINFTYDDLDRPTWKKANNEPGNAFAYDNLGRLTSATKGNNAQSFTWDALGRNLTQAGPQGTVTSQWDPAGRRTRLSWPDGFYLDYDYLVTGEITKVRENGATSGIGVLATYGYDDLGNRTSAAYGNGAAQALGYDAVSRLSSLTVDLAGTASDLTKTFTYNPANQIVTETRSNDAYAFVKANAAQTSATDGLNRLTTVNGTSAAYDARGNMTGDPVTGKTYSYWPSNDQLHNIPSPFATMSYDALDRLTSVQNGGAVTAYLSDGADPIAEYDDTGMLQKRYAFGPGGPLVAYDASGNRSWMLSDERGSVIALADDTSAMTAINTYDEYGIPGASNAGSCASDPPPEAHCARFQYTGMLWLSRAGVYAPTFRAYGAHLGRFNQTDPIGYAAGPNLYAYVLNDPMNRIDPLGLQDQGVNCQDTPEDPRCEVNVTGTRQRKSYCDDMLAIFCNGVSEPLTYAPPGLTGGPGASSDDCAYRNASGQCVYVLDENGSLKFAPEYQQQVCARYSAIMQSNAEVAAVAGAGTAPAVANAASGGTIGWLSRLSIKLSSAGLTFVSGVASLVTTALGFTPPPPGCR